jgi:hypothetical protein
MGDMLKVGRIILYYVLKTVKFSSLITVALKGFGKSLRHIAIATIENLESLHRF